VKNSRILSFARRIGKSLTPAQKVLLLNLMPKYGFSLESLDKYHDYVLEIGFGGGVHLDNLAKKSPDVCHIGCEPYLNGVVSLLQLIKNNNLENILIYQDDAIDLLEKLPDYFLSALYILFPDPWPKLKHHKRRLINTQSLGLFAKKMKKQASLTIATDHEDYAKAIYEYLFSSGLFKLKSNITDYQHQPNDWTKTKYQEKAETLGIKPYFFVVKLI
jgi:tRNA (guanine-N7-)-methyltransferase